MSASRVPPGCQVKWSRKSDEAAAAAPDPEGGGDWDNSAGLRIAPSNAAARSVLNPVKVDERYVKVRTS